MFSVYWSVTSQTNDNPPTGSRRRLIGTRCSLSALQTGLSLKSFTKAFSDARSYLSIPENLQFSKFKIQENEYIESKKSDCGIF
jgi:hypothetical protein